MQNVDFNRCEIKSLTKKVINLKINVDQKVIVLIVIKKKKTFTHYHLLSIYVFNECVSSEFLLFVQ